MHEFAHASKEFVGVVGSNDSARRALCENFSCSPHGNVILVKSTDQNSLVDKMSKIYKRQRDAFEKVQEKYEDMKDEKGECEDELSKCHSRLNYETSNPLRYYFERRIPENADYLRDHQQFGEGRRGSDRARDFSRSEPLQGSWSHQARSRSKMSARSQSQDYQGSNSNQLDFMRRDAIEQLDHVMARRFSQSKENRDTPGTVHDWQAAATSTQVTSGHPTFNEMEDFEQNSDGENGVTPSDALSRASSSPGSRSPLL